MALYQIQNLSFAYPGDSPEVLSGVDLDIMRGELVLICGPTGSGKTTLLRLLKKEIQPEGEKKGNVLYGGALLEEVGPRRGVEEIAMVFQDADDQIVMETVWQELVFAMENLGYAPGDIQRRLAEVVNYFGMEEWLHKPVHELSGGQKQLLNLAAVMMLRPRVLLLDEPTAQLDPIAAKEFLQTVYRINQELSTTVIISEHRLEEAFPLATRVIMLYGGNSVYQAPPREVIREVWELKDDRFFEYLPSVSRLYLSMNGTVQKETGRDTAIPLTVREMRGWAEEDYLEKRELWLKNKPQGNHASSDNPGNIELISCREIYFQYQRDHPQVLKKLSLSINRGEFFTLLGGNGSGKTTLLKALTGIVRPQRGAILWEGKNLFRMSEEERNCRMGYLAQNPSLYFSRDTVEGQLNKRAEELGLDESIETFKRLISLFEIEDILKKHPYDISGGQQQKVALALVLLSSPDLLLLDEPTKGLDPLWKLQLAELLGRLISEGSTIFMVSHDIEFAAKYADRCALLFDGQIIAPDNPRNFFRGNYFYTTVMQRALGDMIPEAVSLKDVSLC